ncbi:MAG: hypothetical protein GKR92_07045 [Gammaproteobacteria bacterium]|nr:MAG: hypothetical protein GKR92_07045 [Gammaproteobacteria bacterium]
MKIFAKMSPGFIAHSEAIKLAFANIIKSYNFMMASGETYKNQYNCRTENMFNLIIFNSTLKAFLLHKWARIS